MKQADTGIYKKIEVIIPGLYPQKTMETIICIPALTMSNNGTDKTNICLFDIKATTTYKINNTLIKRNCDNVIPGIMLPTN
jgi:hypothetical protein